MASDTAPAEVNARSGGGLDAAVVLAALPVGLIVLGPDGNVVVSNEAAERILAVPDGALVGRGPLPAGWRLVQDDGTPLPEERHPARVALRTGATQRDEVLGLRRPDGSVAWVSVSCVPLPVAGPPEGRHVVATMVDVTRPRQRTRALAARETQLLRALERAPFVLWSADARGRLAYLAGEDPVRRVGLIGRPAVQLFPDDAAFPGHLERTLAGARFTALVHSGDKVLETLFYPAYSTEGAIDGVSGISVDVTARVAAEADQGRLRTALQHAAHEWRTTFDAIDAPAILIAPDDTVRRVNRATRDLWGRPYEEIVGSRLPERGPGLPWASIRQATAQCRSGGQPVTLQARDETDETYWDVTANLVSDSGDAAGAVIALARDVSRIVALRESLRRNERMSMMGELVSGVAHQVRNPLFGISSTLDACDEEFGALPGVRDCVATLRAETARLSRLMTHLLDYGRAGSAVHEEGLLADVVASAVSLSRAIARESGVEVVASVADDIPALPLDPGRLPEAFHNLIENAIQHSARAGRSPRHRAPRAPPWLGGGRLRCRRRRARLQAR